MAAPHRCNVAAIEARPLQSCGCDDRADLERRFHLEHRPRDAAVEEVSVGILPNIAAGRVRPSARQRLAASRARRGVRAHRDCRRHADRQALRVGPTEPGDLVVPAQCESPRLAGDRRVAEGRRGGRQRAVVNRERRWRLVLHGPPHERQQSARLRLQARRREHRGGEVKDSDGGLHEIQHRQPQSEGLGALWDRRRRLVRLLGEQGGRHEARRRCEGQPDECWPSISGPTAEGVEHDCG
mmetsp:Transcript_77331/g.224361  ORF Transcript_77331/g.224361 Transcript_77331/m.224361 type:complete len:240 (+) Transcript_77331:227-946(+)